LTFRPDHLAAPFLGMIYSSLRVHSCCGLSFFCRSALNLGRRILDFLGFPQKFEILESYHFHFVDQFEFIHFLGFFCYRFLINLQFPQNVACWCWCLHLYLLSVYFTGCCLYSCFYLLFHHFPNTASCIICYCFYLAMLDFWLCSVNPIFSIACHCWSYS